MGSEEQVETSERRLEPFEQKRYANGYGSAPTEVIPSMRAVRLFFAGDQLIFAGGWMGEFPLYEVTVDGR
jgi:hypothetical protein